MFKLGKQKKEEVKKKEEKKELVAPKAPDKTKIPIVTEEKALFKMEKMEPMVLPEITDKTKFDIRYPLIKPYATAHVFWDDKNSELVYSVEEPILDEKEKKILATLEEGIRELINISFISIKEAGIVIEYLEKNMKVLLDELSINISKESFLKLMYYIYRDFVGLNDIEPIMSDYFIEDVQCNGLNSPLYVVHRKYRNMRTNVIYTDGMRLSSFVEKIAQKCGKYISYASPLLDGALPDGSRVNATYTQDISSKGPTFTIRKFTKEPWTPTRLIDFKTASPELLAYLWILIEYECNVMVIGGTGSGKTTFLNALAFFIPPQARIVSIEDTRELNILHENWLPSVSRAGSGGGGEGAEAGHGAVSLFDLLRESFRQRPDYVIVGEVRGKEAYVLFQGAASGHPSFSTMHAEDVDTMIRRLETPPISLSPSLVESLDVVCVMTQTKLKDNLVRRLREVDEIIHVSDSVGGNDTNTPFMWDPHSDRFFFKTDSRIFDKIVLHHGITREGLNREFRIRTMLLMKMYHNKIFGFKEVQDIIHSYYKTPDKVLKKFNIIV